MIFVALGNGQKPFLRLVLSAEAAFRKLREPDILWQLGSTNYRPEMGRVFDRMERGAFAVALAECRTLVCHAGGGTVMEAIRAGKLPLVMARLREHGEIVDDHQLQLLAAMVERRMVVPVANESDIANAVEGIRAGRLVPPPCNQPAEALVYVERFLDEVKASTAERGKR